MRCAGLWQAKYMQFSITALCVRILFGSSFFSLLVAVVVNYVGRLSNSVANALSFLVGLTYFITMQCKENMLVAIRKRSELLLAGGSS